MKGAGLKFRGWHGFRRDLATNLHDRGVDDLTIKAILGHSNVAVTEQSYIKTLPQQSVEATNTFDAEWNRLNASLDGVVQ